MGMKPKRLSFRPALPCVVCEQPATAGHIYTMNPLVWQLVPLCNEHTEELPGSDKPVAISALQYRISEQLTMVRQLQRRRHRIARAYVRLRRQHAHTKAQRALRWRLNRASQLQAEALDQADCCVSTELEPYATLTDEHERDLLLAALHTAQEQADDQGEQSALLALRRFARALQDEALVADCEEQLREWWRRHRLQGEEEVRV